MIITAPASTIRAALERAGIAKHFTVRTGRAAETVEQSCIDDSECSLRIATMSNIRDIEMELAEIAKRYGVRQ